jgi:hypothetical protein
MRSGFNGFKVIVIGAKPRAIGLTPAGRDSG